MDSIESPAKINKRKRLVTTAVEITMQTGVTKQPKGKQNKQINSNKLKGSQRGCKEVNQSNEDVNKLQGETAYERLYKMVKDNRNVRNVPKVRSTRSNHSPLRSELPQRQQPQKKNGSPKVFSAVNTNMSRSMQKLDRSSSQQKKISRLYLIWWKIFQYPLHRMGWIWM